MNILMVLSQVEVTGAEVYAATISDKLIRKGHKVFIVSDTLTVSTKAKYYPLPLNKRRLDRQIYHVFKLVQIIKKNNVMALHAHSRIASKLGYIASRICGIPMIYTAHGHHHVHLSKKVFPAFGDYTLAICENVKDQITKDLGWNSEKIEILRNGVDSTTFNPSFCAKKPTRHIVSIIGRLSGPKGDTAYKVLEEICIKKPIDISIDIKVVGGSKIPERFSVFKHAASFSGFAGNVRDQIAKSSLVIGSGRVAMESLMMGKPTIAFGEAACEGLVTDNNFNNVLKSNFGDIAANGNMDLSHLKEDIAKGIEMGEVPENIRQNILSLFDLDKVTNRLEDLYQSFYSKKKYEVPILLYHRIITDSAQAGKHGTYVTLRQLEEHFKYLKRNNYTPITFKDISLINRFDPDKKYVILTFDDGYRDNYTLLTPLLDKYKFKAVIYVVTDKAENSWDLKDEGRTFPLLTREQILEMSRHGVEFGAHTMNHVDLTQVGIEEAWKEITGSKKYLQDLLGKDVKTFAYPYGKVNEAVKELVRKAGFKYGIGTVDGPLSMQEDLLNIRRIVIHPDTGVFRFARKVKGNYTYRKNKGFVYGGEVANENLSPAFSGVNA
jgi:peptidoglycan/xylan/chitin deacetylase (PgdA/CDA1 family)/glycosyltransferase involved in cell wall biosynthesis